MTTMDTKTLSTLAVDLSIFSRVLDSAGEQHADQDVSAIAYRLRGWATQLEFLLEETERPSPTPRDQGTE